MKMFSNMTTNKIGMILLLMCLVMLQAAEGYVTENETQEERLDVVVLLTKKHVNYHLERSSYIARQEQHLDQIPYEFAVLFNTTIYLETALLCFVLPYGVFQLRCWSTLFQKCFRTKAKSRHSEINEHFEMVETEHDEETTSSDVIVNFSDTEI